MATSEIGILVTLKDEASAAFQKMSGTFGSALSNATGASVAFGGAIAAVGVGLFGAARAAADAEKVHKQLDAVLKSTGRASGLFREDILEQAAALSKLTNFEDEAIVSAQNLLLTFTNIKGPVFQEATSTLLDMATAMGTDAKSGAIQLGKALNDPIAGISALSRVGVTFTDDQKKVIQTLVETGNVAGAQKVILAELAKEFGGSAQAQVDPFIQMQNAFGDAVELIGTEFIPVVNQISKALTVVAEDVVPVMIEKVKQIITFFKENKLAIYILSGAIIGALVPAIYAATTAFFALMVPLLPFMIGGAIIAGIVAGIVWIVQNWSMLSAKAFEIWGLISSFILGVVTSIGTAITNAFTAITSFLTTAWEGIKEIFVFSTLLILGLVMSYFQLFGIDIVAVFTTLVQFFAYSWEIIKTIFISTLTFLSQMWTTVWTAIGNTIGPVWEKIKTAVGVGWEYINYVFNSFMGPLSDAWNGLWTGLGNTVGGIWDSIKETVKSSINWIIEKINKFIQAVNDVVNKAGGVVGVKAPNIPKIPMLADGGIVNKPTLAVIGEAGPEAVVPLSRSNGFGMGGGITINMGTVMTGPEYARELGREMALEIKRQIRI